MKQLGSFQYCLTDCPSDFTFNAQTSGHLVSLSRVEV